MTKPKSTHGGPGRGGGRNTKYSGPAIRRNVSIPQETIDKAGRIGNGNVSEGIWRAVAAYREDDKEQS